MKCPKCSYISFDDADRCRNCGYDFAFARTREEPEVELPLRGSEVEEPTADLPLVRNAPPTPPPQHASRGGSPAPSARPSAADLPLFDAPVPGIDDTPLITAPAPPRPPLAVRRSTIEPPRPRPAERPSAPADAATPMPSAEPASARAISPAPPVLDVDRQASTRPPRVDRTATPVEGDAVVAGDLAAPVARRVIAAIIDLLLIGGIDAAVIWFTLQVTGLPVSRVRILPIVPMLLFFALLNGGYLVGFTAASGQTIGKMLTGVRVVGETTRRVPLGNAVVRAAASLLTVVSLGIGYVPAFGTGERRTLHDRLAKTRVVRR